MLALSTAHPAQIGHGGPRGTPHATALVAAVALVVVACGDPAAPGTGPTNGPEARSEGVAVAPECAEVAALAAEAPEEGEPTGTTAAPVDDGLVPGDGADRQAPGRDGEPGAAGEAPPTLPSQIERWAQQEATHSFAGLWVDQDLGGFVVAFATDVDRYADEVRERFHPGLAIAEAQHSQAELREIQDRISQEATDIVFDETGAVRSVGVDVVRNRTTVGIFDPGPERLAELSETYGVSAICFEIEPPPAPIGEGLAPLAKASGWREDLGSVGTPFAVLEVAFDRATAERAWRDNVPDDLDTRRDDLPAEPGRYGDLDAVDFDRQALVVWSSGESGSCAEWVADIDTVDGTVRVQRGATAQTCTSDYNPYRMVLAVDRDRLPQPGDLPHDRIEDLPDGEVRAYPDR